jgi:hypothetical protein
MTKEHEIELQNKNPNLLETLFGTTGSGIECGDGWYWLLDKTLMMIFNISYGCVFPLRVHQIRSSQGVLKIYFSNMAEYKEFDEERGKRIQAVTDFAQLLSNSICERCGKIEKIGSAFDGAFYFTRCRECFAGDYTLRTFRDKTGTQDKGEIETMSETD